MAKRKDRELFFLSKVAQFVKLALSENRQLKQQVDELSTKRIKQAQEELQLESAVDKAAKALYDSDFLTDQREVNQFVKKANSDPIYLANTLTKVCNAADVALIGLPAKTAESRANEKEEYDPVMAKAFGWYSNNILD